jgi:AmmeMemoRadiSam system protein B
MRPAIVAGKFYPGVPTVLKAEVLAYVGEAAARLPEAAAQPKALIVPHAGYV